MFTKLIKEYRTASFSIVMSLLLIFGWWHYRHFISNEILVSISPQKEYAPLEKSIFSGDSFTVNFQCEGNVADRWILYITTTSNLNNFGLLTIEADNASPKTFRTRFFSKFAGTYAIPLPKKSDKLPERVAVKFSLTGGKKDKPMLYLPATVIDKSCFYQISLQPEKGEVINLPNNVAFPLSLTKFSMSGSCKILSDGDSHETSDPTNASGIASDNRKQ